jgi:AcrR family transcriptional regulator
MKKSMETQQRILNAAIKLFAAKGYHGTATVEIAIEATVAEGTIFKYYKTKKQLLRGVLEFIIHEIIPSIMKLPSENVLQSLDLQNGKAAVKQVLLEKVELIYQNKDCFKIVLNELQYHEDLKNEYLGRLLPGFIKYMEGIFNMGVEKGVFRSMNSHTAVRSFMGMYWLMMIEKIILNQQLNISQELDGALDIYMNGVIIGREVE